MDNISKILDVILQEGRSEAGKIEENGKKRAAELFRQSEEEGLRNARAILQKAEKKAGEIRQSSLSQAEVECRNIKLSARRTALAQTFAKAEERLAAMSEAGKLELYEKLIARYSSGSDAVVRLNTADGEKIGRKLKVKGIRITIDKQPGDFSGGLIIREGDRQTDCTFGAMTEQARKELEPMAAAKLFS